MNVPLETPTALAAVNAWDAGTTWDAQQRQQLSDHLVALSGYVTPYVVRDEPISDIDLQQYLLQRSLAKVTNWLIGTATTLRAGFGLSEARQTRSGVRGLGLRSATLAEIAALPGIDEVTARRIAMYLTEHPSARSMAELLAVRGIGPQRLGDLLDTAYLERPRAGLISPTLWAFLTTPSVGTLLPLLNATDLSVWFGDYNSADRQTTSMSSDPFDRFLAFLTLVVDQTARTSSIADAATTGQAVRWLARHAFLEQRLSQLNQPISGEILVDGDYLPAVTGALDSAANSIDLLMFLGTSTVGTPAAPGPLALVEALTRAAQRGVQTRVVLDQDDGGEPYQSLFINEPLVRRLQQAGVPVKLDSPATLLHSKVLVIDERITITGSHNWTLNSLSMSHELSILTRNQGHAQQARARFETLWTSLPNLAPIP